MGFNRQEWLDSHTYDLQDRVVAITGATSVLGRYVVRDLLKVNAQVVMLDRDLPTMQKFSEELKAEFPHALVECVQIDLSQIKSIDSAVTQIINRRLDYLILGVGVFKIPVATSQLGYNNIFQINFVGQYYLMRQLLPALQRNNGKVVALTSYAYNEGKLDEDDIDYSKYSKQPSKIYGNAKRFLTLALSEFFKDRDDVRLALVHTGIVTRSALKILFPKPEIAALNIVRGVFENITCEQWIGPKIAKFWGVPTVMQLPTATAEERAKIYNIAENICKVIDKSTML